MSAAPASGMDLPDVGPAWLAAAGTAAAYLALLAVMTVLLFAVPTLLFEVL